MASRYSIETIFKAIDKFSDPLTKMTKSQKKFSSVLKTDFAKAQRSVDNFGRNFQRRIGVGVAVASGIALAGITKFVMDSSAAWDKQNLAIKGTEATLKSTGGVVGRTLQQLEDQASSIQKNTFFGDETVLQNLTSQMLTFTNITGTQFDRAQMAVVDVTAKLNGLGASGENLQATTIQLSKALNDPVANLGALSRSGIQFSKGQKDQIKLLVQSGKLWKAQDMILSEIEKQYGGTAAALTQTTAGLHKQNMNIIGDIQEQIGKAIEPLRMKILQFVNQGLKKIDVQKLADNIAKTATALFNFGKGFMMVLKFLKPFLILIGSVVLVWKAYQASLIIAAAAQWAMNGAMIANPVGLIIVGIGLLIGLIVLLALNWNKVVNALKIAWNWFVKMYDIFKGLLIPLYPFIGVLLSLVEIIRSVATNWDAIVTAFKSDGIIGGIMAIGKAILSGILSPFESLFNLLGKIPGVGGIFKNAGMDIGKFKEGLFGGEAPVNQADRYSYSRSESVSKGELTIKDTTGKAQMTKKPAVNDYQIKFARSGAF
jgi:hypothetical protein